MAPKGDSAKCKGISTRYKLNFQINLRGDKHF